jgi:CRP-like cAMP-binding protein
MISLQVLQSLPHFSGLSESYIEEISRISSARNFEAGEELFREGDAASHLMIVLVGEIDIVYELGSGQKVVADTLAAGDELAWSALLEPHYLTASGIAHKDGSLLQIEAAELRRLCLEDTDFGFLMMKQVAGTLRDRLSAIRVKVAAGLGEPG